MSISEAQKQIVRSTLPTLHEHGKEITSIFYKHLFSSHPELLNLFNQTNQKLGAQPLALANIIYFAAENIDRLESLRSEIDIVAHKHRALTVQPEHYPIVGQLMLRAIAECLGEGATTELLEAWAAAYQVIAAIFIETEKKLYAALGDKEENQGFIPFKIVKKELIAHGPIYSLEIERADGGKMVDYHPGQYITLRLKKDGLFHHRHYGLVRPFDGHVYRVGIKVESEREPKGIFTTELLDHYHEGDTIFASLPAGTFTIVEQADEHLFVAGGVGITVLSTMIEDLCRRNQGERVTVIHCVASPGHAAYTDRLRGLLPAGHFHLLHQTREKLHDLLRERVTPNTHVYICAAPALVKAVEDSLAECHLPASHIHMNTFRPSLSTVKNAVKDQSTTHSL